MAVPHGLVGGLRSGAGVVGIDRLKRSELLVVALDATEQRLDRGARGRLTGPVGPRDLENARIDVGFHLSTGYRQGWSNGPRDFSKAAPIRSAIASPPPRATICNPPGSPAGVNPMGTDRAHMAR